MKFIRNKPDPRACRRPAAALPCAALATLLGTAPARAHAFGPRYDLPPPLNFYLAFAVFGRFAPIGAPQPASSGDGSRHWFLRPYASALVADRPWRLSLTVFVLVMLSTVTFDGFKETPVWRSLSQAVALEPAFHPLIRALHDFGFDYLAVLSSVVLALFPFVFLAVYLGFCWLASWAAGGRSRRSRGSSSSP